ncbi:MAG TPA: hypothetical protein VFU64_07055 [Gaiellaceae bacterium]|nr:hypothetical protein [Gaiellaceae bacterium]
MRLPTSSDTRLLVAGVAAFLALAAYLAVAFATTHTAAGLATAPTIRTNRVAPWTPSGSKLVAGPRARAGYVVRVTPTGRGIYGALLPTLVANPAPGHRFLVGLSLRGAGPGRIGVTIDEFRPGATSVYVVQKTVPTTARWRRFTFRGRIEGNWLGLGMFVFRVERGRRTSFALRDLSVTVLPR